MKRLMTPATLIPALMIAAVFAMVIAASVKEGRRSAAPSSASLSLLGEPGAPATTRDGLTTRIKALRKTLADRPDDVRAAVVLADALIRSARLSGSGGAAREAEAVIERALAADRDNYDALRMKASLLLSQHRFRDALEVADDCRERRPNDPVNYGAIGDAHLELGEYDQAYDAFEQMMRLRPGPGSYARIAYANELQGNLEAALASMRLAAEASEGADVEALAWYRSQVGELLLRMNRPGEAKAAFTLASQAFPGHPFAVLGYAKALAASGDRTTARSLLEELVRRSPTADAYVLLGDLATQAGGDADAQKYWSLAEAIWRSDAPEPKNFARFLAERGWKIDEAVQIAEAASRERDDIFTNDALAWAYFKAGRTIDARQAIERALRTGTRDEVILRHAAAIREAAPAMARR